MMKVFIPFVSLLTFIGTHPVHATPTSTDRFLAALTDELEAKVIGDDELVALIESAETGRLANPICEATAELSTARLLAYQGFQAYTDAGDLDAASVAAWARANLADQKRGRLRRDESRKETELPWTIEASLLSGGNYHACAVNTDGYVKCWGSNVYGQSTPPADLGVVRSVSAGGFHSCAVKTDGYVRCWGDNSHGGQSTPPSGLGEVQSLSMGRYHTCAVKTDGSVRCWGNNEFGQSTPPSDLGVVQSTSAGRDYACALNTTGILRCWGNSVNGPSTPPSDLGAVQSMSAGEYLACAVKSDGYVKCWGIRHSDWSPPVDLGVVQTVSAGAYHACAVRADGSLRCWRQGGFASTTIIPTDIGMVRSVSTGVGHSCAVKIDNSVKCWGDDSWSHLDVPEGLIVKSRWSKL